MVAHEDRTITVAGARIRYLVGGSGPPLLALHSVEGSLGWLRLYDELARDFTVFAPIHPGFTGSDRPEWLESALDLARFYLWIVQELGLDRATLLGYFFGGWLAAEMAVMAPPLVDRLILIDSAGIKPGAGAIADIFLHGSEGVRDLAFCDRKQVADYDLLFGRKPSAEEREALQINREAAIRYCWKPYMHDPALPHLLPRLRATPTLIVWGREDRIAPLECAEMFRQVIPGAQLSVIERAGHYPFLEQPAAVSAALQAFLEGR